MHGIDCFSLFHGWRIKLPWSTWCAYTHTKAHLGIFDVANRISTGGKGPIKSNMTLGLIQQVIVPHRVEILLKQAQDLVTCYFNLCDW